MQVRFRAVLVGQDALANCHEPLTQAVTHTHTHTPEAPKRSAAGATLSSGGVHAVSPVVEEVDTDEDDDVCFVARRRLARF